MDRAHDSFVRALEEERQRSGLQLVRLRSLGLTVFLLLQTVFWLVEPRWIGALDVFALYWLVAAAVFWASRHSEAVARMSGMTIPIVDMPMILLLVSTMMSRLDAAGVHAEAYAMRLGAAAFYVLLVFLSSLSLDSVQVLLAGVVAAVCQTVLIVHGGPDVTLILVMSATMGLATIIGLYAIRKTTHFVDEVTGEELRRERLGRYFSPQVAERIEQGDGGLGSGESREVTIMFCDIREFTSLSERLRGDEVVALLNDFHTRMIEQVFAHGGTLDKLMGDGIMAYFGAPVAQNDHALRAVRCALAMQQGIARLNEERDARGQSALRMGLGIHTGTVVLGNIGAPQRRDYTIIGDAVNVAARLEELTKELEVPALVSAATRRLVGAGIEFSAARPARIRGRAEPIECFVPQGKTDLARKPQTRQ